jgi:hypothetical protein
MDVAQGRGAGGNRGTALRVMVRSIATGRSPHAADRVPVERRLHASAATWSAAAGVRTLRTACRSSAVSTRRLRPGQRLPESARCGPRAGRAPSPRVGCDLVSGCRSPHAADRVPVERRLHASAATWSAAAGVRTLWTAGRSSASAAGSPLLARPECKLLRGTVTKAQGGWPVVPRGDVGGGKDFRYRGCAECSVSGSSVGARSFNHAGSSVCSVVDGRAV